MKTIRLIICWFVFTSGTIGIADEYSLPPDIEAFSSDRTLKLRLEIPRFKSVETAYYFQTGSYPLLTASEGEEFAGKANVIMRLYIKLQNSDAYKIWWARPSPTPVIPNEVAILNSTFKYAIILNGRFDIPMTNAAIPFSVFSNMGKLITNGVYDGAMLPTSNGIPVSHWIMDDSSAFVVGKNGKRLISVEIP